MIRLTVQAVLGDTSEQNVALQESETLFVVREDAVVFWVEHGAPRRRLREHLGIDDQWPSQMGTLILNNYPESMHWIVELWDISDCEPYRHDDGPLDEERARLALVAHFRPCLNVSDNPNPTPLPDAYRASLSQSPPRNHINTLLGRD